MRASVDRVVSEHLRDFEYERTPSTGMCPMYVIWLAWVKHVLEQFGP